MRRFLAIIFASTFLLASCGGSDTGPDPAEDPKGALTSALDALGDYEGLTAELSLNTDEQSLIAVSEGELTEDQVATLLDSSLRMTSKGGDKPEDAQFELVADIAGDLVELRAVDQVIYVRADVRELVERFGGTQSDIDRGLQDAPPQFSFLNQAVEGEWIGIEGAEEFAKQFGGVTQEDQEEAMELQKEIATKLGDAIDENSTVESIGSDDIGEHLEVNLDVRPLAEAFVEIVRSVPGGEAIPADAFNPADVPDEQLPVDVWIDDGRITQIELDLVKIAEAFEADPPPEGVESFKIRVTIEEFTGDVEAPDAAETVNIGELMQMFMGGMGMGAGAGSTEGTPGAPDLSELCAQLEGQPEEVVSQFAEECPELQQ